jgi:hypothetical protein
LECHGLSKGEFEAKLGELKEKQALAEADRASAKSVIVHGFQFRGATGSSADALSGVFKRSGETKNGEPVYVKVGLGGHCLWYGPDSYWYVSAVATHKDLNKAGGYAHPLEAGLAQPDFATGWNISTAGKWGKQHAVTLHRVGLERVMAEEQAAAAEGAAAASELAELRSLVFTGAEGLVAPHINATFDRTNEVINGKPVFQHAIDPSKCCWYADDDHWYVCDTASHKDARKAGGYAHSKERRLVHPGKASSWNVSEKGVWGSQPVVAKVVLVQDSKLFHLLNELEITPVDEYLAKFVAAGYPTVQAVLKLTDAELTALELPKPYRRELLESGVQVMEADQADEELAAVASWLAELEIEPAATFAQAMATAGCASKDAVFEMSDAALKGCGLSKPFRKTILAEAKAAKKERGRGEVTVYDTEQAVVAPAVKHDEMALSAEDIAEVRKMEYAQALEDAQLCVQQDTLLYIRTFDNYLKEEGGANYAERDRFDQAAYKVEDGADRRQCKIQQPTLDIDPANHKMRPKYAILLQKQFRKSMAATDKALMRIASAADGVVHTGKPKDKKRLFEKARLSYGGSLVRVTDFERRSIVCDDFAGLITALEMVDAQFTVLRIKNRFAKKNDSAKKTASYRDCQLTCHVLGTELMFELQLHLQATFQIKQEVAHSAGPDGRSGHDRYIQFRKLKETADFEYAKK